MDDRIYEKLNEIKDLKDRVLLKQIMNSVFEALEQYSTDRIDELEEKVFNEVPYIKEKYNIYSTIVKRERLDITDKFLHPILQEDTEETVYDNLEILQALENNEAKNMFKVFLKCDYLTVQEFLDNNMDIEGIIETNKKVHKAFFKVNKNKQYTDRICRIYKSFINSNIAWTTINNPYIHKIADVALVGCEDKIEDDEEIIKIEVNFGEYNKYIEYDMVPIWNIKELTLKSQGYSIPCIDRINYNYNVSIEKEGKNNGYLVDYENVDTNYVTFEETSIVITSERDLDTAIFWNLWCIVSPNERQNEKYEYEIMSNEVNINFANKFAFQKPYSIKTKAELARVINSFKISQKLIFKEFELQEDYLEKIKQTYEVNNFIIDEIRDENIKKILVLYFEPVNVDSYLNQDILSFLVSEIQYLYPEYECEGKLI
jgi:hypothetical protein